MVFTKFTEIPIGPVNIKVWGLLVALGMLAGLLFTLKQAKKKRINPDLIYDLFLIVFISSMLGGRLFYVLLYPDKYLVHPLNILKFWQGGMVIYGGFLAALLAIFIYLKKKKINFWKITDLIAPGFALGLFIGRIGCFLIGDHIGAPTSLPFGSYYNGETFLRHEPSLYLSLKGLIIFLILWLLRKKFKKTGAISALFLVLYSVLRFGIDFTRASDLPEVSDLRFWHLTISQYLAVIIFFITLIWVYKKRLWTLKK